MKKGFTLVELLGIIIILGVIMMIAFPIINKTIKDSKEEAYDMQVKMILESARTWAIDNANRLPDEGTDLKLMVLDLIRDGYIKDLENGVLINPLDESKTMDGCVTIEYSSKYNQYIYEYDEEC